MYSVDMYIGKGSILGARAIIKKNVQLEEVEQTTINKLWEELKEAAREKMGLTRAEECFEIVCETYRSVQWTGDCEGIDEYLMSLEVHKK